MGFKHEGSNRNTKNKLQTVNPGQAGGCHLVLSLPALPPCASLCLPWKQTTNSLHSFAVGPLPRLGCKQFGGTEDGTIRHRLSRSILP